MLSQIGKDGIQHLILYLSRRTAPLRHRKRVFSLGEIKTILLGEEIYAVYQPFPVVLVQSSKKQTDQMESLITGFQI